MPLTKKQRENLESLVRGALEDNPALRSVIEAEVQNHLKSGGTGAGYAQHILEGSRPEHGARTYRAGRELTPGLRTFARLSLAAVIGGGDRAATQDAARTLDVEDEFTRAMSAGSAAGGGLLLSEATADEVIEALRGMSIVRRAGPRGIEIPAGTLRTPRIDTGVSSGYIGEGEAIPSSDIKTGAVNLIGRKLAALVIVSNELSMFATNAGDVDAIIADDALASISETEDTAFLLGTGTENEPKGIVNWAAAGQKFNANGTVNVANTVADLRKAMNRLLTSDVPMRNPVWLWAPRTSTYLRTLLNTNGQFVFRDEIDRGRLFGYPYFESTHVPVNLGTGEDESLIIFVDMSEVMIGDVRQVAIERSNQAAATIDGVLTSLFETDRSALRIRTWNDLALRHAVSASVIEAVKWGA